MKNAIGCSNPPSFFYKRIVVIVWKEVNEKNWKGLI
jgi:hypothetical protein